jgi:hypothetical protein
LVHGNSQRASVIITGSCESDYLEYTLHSLLNLGPRDPVEAQTKFGGTEPETTVMGEITLDVPITVPPSTIHLEVTHAPSSMTIGFVIRPISVR